MNNQEILNLLKTKYKKYLDNDDLEGLLFAVPENQRTTIASFLMFTVGMDLLDQMEEIPGKMFFNCDVLEDIVIPKNIKKMGNSAFANSSVKRFRIQEGSTLSEIPKDCFKNCSELELVSLPLSVRTIGVDAFNGCSNLHKIVTPKRNKRVEKITISGSDEDFKLIQSVLVEKE